MNSPVQIRLGENAICASFTSMASPCELLIDTQNKNFATEIANLAYNETRRIEQKYSRYLSGNLCHAINNSGGKETAIDEECFRLLEFSNQCYDLSNGMFDITSGVLRKAWQFNGSDHIPHQADIDKLLNNVGWEKVSYNKTCIQMSPEMEIDFGGIGKEYAVSSVAQLCIEHSPATSIVVNFGGDIQITQPRTDNTPWLIGIENPDREDQANSVLKIMSGALATSGDSRRFLLRNGIRYSHVLNPKTGWPISNAPRSITVAGEQCVQTGCLATLALLQGQFAEDFLQAQNVKYWCIR